MMKSADISNDFLAIGCNRGQILIWCLKTKKLVRSLLQLAKIRIVFSKEIRSLNSAYRFVSFSTIRYYYVRLHLLKG